MRQDVFSLAEGEAVIHWPEPPKGGFFKCRILGVSHSSYALRDAYPARRSFAFPTDQGQRISKGTWTQIWIQIQLRIWLQIGRLPCQPPSEQFTSTHY